MCTALPMRKKLVPRNWMTRDGSYVTEDFIDYIKPLIQEIISQSW